MIQAEGERIAATAEPLDQDKIRKQLESLGERWSQLLDKAGARYAHWHMHACAQVYAPASLRHHLTCLSATALQAAAAGRAAGPGAAVP